MNKFVFFVLFFILSQSRLAATENATYGLTGEWGGVRSNLASQGLELHGSYFGIACANVIGGIEQGGVYNGLAELSLSIDSQKMGLWPYGRIFIKGAWRHSFQDRDSISVDYAGSFQSLHRIDDTGNYLHLDQYWIMQGIWENRLGIKIGRQNPWKDFLNQKYSRLFTASSFNYLPTVPLPRYRTFDNHFFSLVTSPVRKQHASALGISIWADFTDWIHISMGLFDQRTEPEHLFLSETSQTRKNMSAVFEVVFSPKIPLKNSVSGAYRFGVWYVNRTDMTDKPEDEIHPHAKKFGGTGGPYFTFDQQIYKENSNADDEQGLALFGQFGFAPGKWEVFLYYGLGIMYEGLLPHRDNDVLGFAVGIADFSEKMEGDVDERTGDYITTFNMKNLEALFEWKYILALQNALSIHTTFQWVRIPKGITENDDIFYNKDAFVISLSTIIDL